MQIDLAAIDEDVPTSGLVRKASACPAGLVWSGGHCAARDGVGAYQCAAGQVGDCFDQCDEGDQRSCVTLAAMLATGDGAPKDLSRAHALSQVACDADVGEGCLWAGRVREEEQRYDEAAEAFERGCAQGVGQACLALASMVRDAKGIKRDDKRIARLMVRGSSMVISSKPTMTWNGPMRATASSSSTSSAKATAVPSNSNWTAR